MDYLIYLNQMNNCVSSANKIIEKAESYESYSKTLQSVSENISTIANDLSSAYTNFVNGGYNSNGQGLYQNEILLCSGNATAISSLLHELSNKTLRKINDFKLEYNNIKNSYESAKHAFYSCKIHSGVVPVFPNFTVNVIL